MADRQDPETELKKIERQLYALNNMLKTAKNPYPIKGKIQQLEKKASKIKYEIFLGR